MTFSKYHLLTMEDDLRATDDDLEVMGEGLRLMLGLMEDDHGQWFH